MFVLSRLGTTDLLSVPTMGSFFRNQTFPSNWHRRSSPAGLTEIGNSAGDILSAHPLVPGANDASGNYVADPPVGVSPRDTVILRQTANNQSGLWVIQ